MSAERIEGDFYAAQKLPLLLRGREQSDAKNCRHSPRDQMSAQKAKWTWHGRANIRIQRGILHVKAFHGYGSASTFSHVPIPSPNPCPFPLPFSPSFHFTSLLQKASPFYTLTTSSLIYCTHNCKTRASSKT